MNSKPLILGVDRNRRNLELLSRFLGKEGYRVITASALDELERVLGGEQEIQLVLVDISGFDRTIWDYCQRLRDMGIPFLVMSPKLSAALQQTSLAHGARGVLVKPLAVKEFSALIKTLLEE